MTRDDVRKKLEGIVLDNYDFCIATGALSVISRTNDRQDVYRYEDMVKLEVIMSCAKFPVLRITFMEEGEMYKRGYHIKHIRMKVKPSPVKVWLDEACKSEPVLSTENNRVLFSRLAEHVRNIVADYGREWVKHCVLVTPSATVHEAQYLSELLDDAKVVTLASGLDRIMLGDVENWKLCRAFEDDYPVTSDLYE